MQGVVESLGGFAVLEGDVGDGGPCVDGLELAQILYMLVDWTWAHGSKG